MLRSTTPESQMNVKDLDWITAEEMQLAYERDKAWQEQLRRWEEEDEYDEREDR